MFRLHSEARQDEEEIDAAKFLAREAARATDRGYDIVAVSTQALESSATKHGVRSG